MSPRGVKSPAKRPPLKPKTRGSNVQKDEQMKETPASRKGKKIVVKTEKDVESPKIKKEAKNKKGTPETLVKIKPESPGSVSNDEENKFVPQCNFCSSIFKSVAGVRIHEKKCKVKNSADSTGQIEPTVIDIKAQIKALAKPLAKKLKKSPSPEKKAPSPEKKAPSPEKKVPSPEKKAPSPEKKIPKSNAKHRKHDENDFGPEDNIIEEVVDITFCHCCGEDITTAHTVGEFQCYECNKLFPAKSSIERHIKMIHLQVGMLKCSRCEVKCLNRESLARHTCISTEERNQCTCCGENLATAHSVGEFECHDCKKYFQLKPSLERHIKTVHQGDNHECPQCGAKCPDKGTLARHMYTHTGLKPYSCPVCKQEFSRKYHLVRHNMQTGCDGKEKPVFPCLVCGREFNRKDNLREHLRAHAGQTKRKKLYSCDLCGQEFSATNLLQLHKKTHTGEKHYVCDFCPKRFPTSGAVKKHRRTHTGERPYECSTCKKRFAAKETLNRHVRIHTGYKPHVCNYCGKRFIQSSQLRSHLFYHTGQSVLQPNEAFVCELCGKKFNRRARLNEHVKYVHLGAKPFECEQCSKTFIRKEDLNRHLIIHSGVKAHQCPICSKCFAMKSSLKVHLLTHTKEPPRSCDECGRAFIRQDCLLRHMRNKHRDMLEEIRSEAEKKKLQQQLLQVAAEASIVEGLEDRKELDEKGLTEAVRELLTLLVDEATLRGLGWPEAGVEALLEAVIRRCGHEPAPTSTPHHDRLRHNIKLLFTVVIDDSAVKALLNNQSVDEVILHVLRLAKS